MFCPHASLEWWPHITCLYLFVLNIAEQKMFFFSWFIAISTEKNENKNVALSFEVSSRGHHVLFSLSRNEHRVLQKIYFPLITSGNVSLYFKESLVMNEKIPEVWIKYLRLVHVLLSRFYPDFILTLSWFYLNKIWIKWSLFFCQLYPDFIQILSRFFYYKVHFIQILSRFYLNFIRIKLR